MIWIVLGVIATVSTSSQSVRASSALWAMSAFGVAGFLTYFFGLGPLWAAIAFVAASATLLAGKEG